jgi:hypothetical protein
MPILRTIYSLDRLVVGVASETLMLPDLAGFVQDNIRERLQHYRKLLDFANCVADFSEKELTALAQALRERPGATPRGPLAIVADPNRADLAHFFAALGADGRPAKVFRNLRQARAWLLTQPVAES